MRRLLLAALLLAGMTECQAVGKGGIGHGDVDKGAIGGGAVGGAPSAATECTPPAGAVVRFSAWKDSIQADDTMENLGSEGTDCTGTGGYTDLAYVSECTLGQPCYRFDGSADACNFGTNDVCGGGACTVAVVIDPSAYTGSPDIFLGFKSGSNLSEIANSSTSGTYQNLNFPMEWPSGNAPGFDFTAGDADLDPFRAIMVYDGDGAIATDYSARWNNTSPSVAASGLFIISATNLNSVGARISSADSDVFNWGGDIYEILIYDNDTVSTSAIETYFDCVYNGEAAGAFMYAQFGAGIDGGREPPDPGATVHYAARLETAFSDGDPISTVTDFGTESANLTNTGAAGTKPTFKSPCSSGLETDCFDFDGGDWLETAAWASKAQPAVIGARVNFKTITGTEVVYDGLAVGVRHEGYSVAGTPTANAGATLSGGSFSADTMHRFVVKFNGASSEILVDGISLAAGNTSTNGLTGFVVGSYFGKNSSFLNGEIAEMVYVSGSTDTIAVDAYLEAAASDPAPAVPDSNLFYYGNADYIASGAVPTAYGEYADTGGGAWQEAGTGTALTTDPDEFVSGAVWSFPDSGGGDGRIEKDTTYAPSPARYDRTFWAVVRTPTTASLESSRALALGQFNNPIYFNVSGATLRAECFGSGASMINLDEPAGTPEWVIVALSYQTSSGATRCMVIDETSIKSATTGTDGAPDSLSTVTTTIGSVITSGAAPCLGCLVKEFGLIEGDVSAYGLARNVNARLGTTFGGL